jgi:hypothetical protein
MRWIPWLGLGLCLAGTGCGAALSNEDPDRSAANLEAVAAGGSMGCGNSNGRVAVFQNGRMVDGTVYAGTTDTTIRQNKPVLNDATAATCTMKGATKSRIRKECLVRWDLSQLPPTTRVGASCIRFKVTDGSHGSFQAFEALRPWVDTDATWQRATSLDLWQAPGARGAADADAAVVATTPARAVAGGVYEIALASALVQKWVSIPVANNGLVFGGNGGDGLTIVASEQADGPALVVGLP